MATWPIVGITKRAHDAAQCLTVALTRYLHREQRAHFTLWCHVFVPSIATLTLWPVLFTTVYPLPAWPYSLTPYLFLVIVIVGIADMQWCEWRNPGTLQRGARRIVLSGSAGEACDVVESP